MPLNTKTITYQLVAAVANGIAQNQSGTAGTKLTLNGSLVTAGVATLDSGGASRRVLLTPAADESTNSFTIVGTDRNGIKQTEVLAGVANPTTAFTTKDFKTVTSITPTSNTAGNVAFGTNGVGSSTPYIVDWVPNGNLINANLIITGTANATVQEALDDLAPAWDVNANQPNWFNDTNLASKAATTNAILAGPFTMIRLLINSGTGKATLQLVTPFIGGAI